MHLALVTAYPPSRGSLNEYGLHLARALAADPRVTRLTLLADAVEDAPEQVDVERVWRFNDPSSGVRILTALERLEPDAVIFNLQFASFGDQRLPGALGLFTPALSRLRRPTLTLLHNLVDTVDLSSAGFSVNPLIDGATRMAGKLLTRALLASHLVGVTLPAYVDILQQRYRARNVFLSPHGTFEAATTPAPLPRQPTVLAFGKFGTYKRLEALFEAHGRLLERDPTLRLVIAGTDSPNRPGYLEEIRHRYRHLPNVTFTGYVAEEDVPAVFGDSTVVAFPYEGTTGSSGVLHQAGQFARAAVMPDIGDLAELVRAEGYQANFFEPGNPEQLAEALWALLSQPEEARAMGAANHAAAHATPISQVAARQLDRLTRLLAGDTHSEEIPCSSAA